MKQNDLNRAVAYATGESVTTIKRLGFLLADPTESTDPNSEEHGPYVIDWDVLKAQQLEGNAWRSHRAPAVA